VGRKHNLGLLEEGTLHVAKLRDDGSGGWILLVHGQGPLTAANGFASRAEVLINTPGCRRRGRRDQDGPARGHPAQPRQRPGLRQPDQQHRQDPGPDRPANPRGPNPWGHVLEIREDGDDADSTSFTWRIFLLCGDPDDPGTYFAGYPKDKVSPIGSPDNMTFDNEGNIWLASDGTQPTGGNNGLFACRPRAPSGATCSCSPPCRWGPRPAGRCSPGTTGRCSSPSSTPARAARWRRRRAIGRRRGGSLPRPAVTSIWRSADGDPTIGQ
jgi:uncharacterized protein